MKILSYRQKGDMIIITTDDVNRPQFVYKKNKFGSIADLKQEIEKSIKKEKDKKDKKEKNKSDLIKDLIKEKVEILPEIFTEEL